MRFDLTILGSAAAAPSLDRHPTAQVLNIDEHPYLIDCGEGTQIQLLRYNIKRNRIKTIFISHLHGDHYFGLIGLISTLHLQRRSEPLFIIGPEPLQAIIEIQLRASQTSLSYPLHYIVTHPEEPAIVWEDKRCIVSSIPLRHRIPTTGFLFTEQKQKRKIHIEQTTLHQIPTYFMPRLQAGEDYHHADGHTIPNSLLTLDPPAPRSFAYCSDTCYHPTIVTQIQGCHLLYHESTFCNDHLERAQETFHSTAAQAADIAQQAQVQQLLIGHYSSKYTDLNLFLEEAQAIFPATTLAEEGLVISI